MQFLHKETVNKPLSRVILGCMRMASTSKSQATQVIETAYNSGINVFDHADIYGGGQSEEIFSQAISNTSISREQIVLQSKVGIRQGYYDFSKAHIINSVEGILQRLRTDYLDILLLHRPDPLMEVEEVAEAFDFLYSSGKVRSFGVSNHNVFQMALLQSGISFPLEYNQLQFGPAHTVLVDEGINVNTKFSDGIQRGGDILNYCQLNKITPQAWSPFQVDLAQGTFMKHPDYRNLTNVLEQLAREKETTLEALVVAWILRHPAKFQVIIGSMNPSRIPLLATGTDVYLSRIEWNTIYKSADHEII